MFIEIKDKTARYMLVSDNNIYFLDEKGTILNSQKEQVTNIELIKSVYFQDLPSTISLSNFEIKDYNL